MHASDLKSKVRRQGIDYHIDIEEFLPYLDYPHPLSLVLLLTLFAFFGLAAKASKVPWVCSLAPALRYSLFHAV